MKSTKEKGSDAEKYAKKYMEDRRYVCDIHPRTSFYNGRFYQSRENDFFSAADVLCFGINDAALVQVTDTSGNPEDEKIIIDGGHVAYRKDKFDKNFPLTAPYLRILIFLTQKRWVKRPGERRHKEYFHRAWERNLTDHGFVWVERAEWSNLPPHQGLQEKGQKQLPQ
jgi:hypothetical protein